MSAFGGKADIFQGVAECPLIAISGLSGGAAYRVKAERTFPVFSQKACYIPIRFPCNLGERFVEFSLLGILF